MYGNAFKKGTLQSNLYVALEQGDLAQTKFMVEQLEKINTRFKHNDLWITVACHAHGLDVLRYLISKNFQINHSAYPLDKCVMEKHLDMAELLIKHYPQLVDLSYRTTAPYSAPYRVFRKLFDGEHFDVLDQMVQQLTEQQQSNVLGEIYRQLDLELKRHAQPRYRAYPQYNAHHLDYLKQHPKHLNDQRQDLLDGLSQLHTQIKAVKSSTLRM